MGSKEHETKNSGPRSLSVTKCGVQCLHFPSVQQWSSVLFLRGDARDSGLLPAGDRAHFRAAFLQRAYPQLPLTSQVTPGGRGQPSRNTGRGVLLRIWEGKGEKEGGGPQGSPWLEVGVLPRFSPNLGQGHYFSEYEPQFSSKFSKALVTHTPKGVKSPFPLPKAWTGGSPFRSLLALANNQEGPRSSAVPLRLAIPSRWVG